MAETVFSSVSESKVKTLVEDRRNGAKKALYCIEHFDQTLTTLLVGNNIVNTAMSVLAVTFFTRLLVERSSDFISVISTLVVTIVLLIGGEIIPKTLGKKYNERLCLIFGPIVWILSIVLYPVVIIFRGLQKAIIGKNKISDGTVDENELGTILDNMEEEGEIEPEERTMIKNVFDLNDRTVEDIMVPRVDMLAISYDSTIEDAKKMFMENGFSRVPVFKEDKDHIVGILYERDFYRNALQKEDFNDITSIMRKAIFVNKTMTVDKLIRHLQASKMHMAIVSGEYGDTLGIVTMEDALEELVGEIYDEHDEGSIKNTLIHKSQDNVYYVDGECDVDNLFDELEIGDCPDVSKVSTWIFESQDELPKAGDKMVYFAKYTKENEEGVYKDYVKKLTFEVVRVDNRRIEKVRLTVEDATDEEIEALEENEKED